MNRYFLKDEMKIEILCKIFHQTEGVECLVWKRFIMRPEP